MWGSLNWLILIVSDVGRDPSRAKQPTENNSQTRGIYRDHGQTIEINNWLYKIFAEKKFDFYLNFKINSDNDVKTLFYLITIFASSYIPSRYVQENDNDAVCKKILIQFK